MATTVIQTPLVLAAGVHTLRVEWVSGGAFTLHAPAITLGTEALVGVAAGVGVLSGNIAIGIPLTGSVSGLSSATAGISLSGSLASTSAGSGHIDGSLSVAVRIAGATAGVGAVTGSVGVTNAPGEVVGTTAGSSSATAAVRVAVALSGRADGVASTRAFMIDPQRADMNLSPASGFVASTGRAVVKDTARTAPGPKARVGLRRKK